MEVALNAWDRGMDVKIISYLESSFLTAQDLEGASLKSPVTGSILSWLVLQTIKKTIK